jgi:hypothetical protein
LLGSGIRTGSRRAATPPFRRLAALLLSSACLAPVWGAPSVTRDDLEVQKELMQGKLDVTKELLVKDIDARNQRVEALGKRLDDQVTRVSDIGNSVDRFGVLVAILGALLTALLAAAGLVDRND